jgi:hypothetical protein
MSKKQHYYRRLLIGFVVYMTTYLSLRHVKIDYMYLFMIIWFISECNTIYGRFMYDTFEKNK